MEAVVVDAGSRLLKAGFAVPDHPPSMILEHLKMIANNTFARGM